MEQRFGITPLCPAYSTSICIPGAVIPITKVGRVFRVVHDIRYGRLGLFDVCHQSGVAESRGFHRTPRVEGVRRCLSFTNVVEPSANKRVGILSPVIRGDFEADWGSRRSLDEGSTSRAFARRQGLGRYVQIVTASGISSCRGCLCDLKELCHEFDRRGPAGGTRINPSLACHAQARTQPSHPLAQTPLPYFFGAKQNSNLIPKRL